MEFTMNVKFGNAAMQTGEDLAAALRSVADRVERHDNIMQVNAASVFDLNGAPVGGWKVEE